MVVASLFLRGRAGKLFLALFIVGCILGSCCARAKSEDPSPYNKTQGYGEACQGTYLHKDRFNQLYDEPGTGNDCQIGYSCGPPILQSECWFVCIPDIKFIKWNVSNGYTCQCPSAMLATGPECRDFKPQRWVELILELLPSAYSAFMAWHFSRSLHRSMKQAREQKHGHARGMSVWNPKVICLLFGSVALWAYTFIYPTKVIIQMVALPMEINEWLEDKTVAFMLYYMIIAATTTFSGLANVVVGLTWLETYAKVRKMKTNTSSSFRWIRVFVIAYSVGACFINMALVFSRRPSWVEFFGFINCIIIIPTYIWGAHHLGKLLRELAGKMGGSSAPAASMGRSFRGESTQDDDVESSSATTATNASPPLKPADVERKVSRKGSKMLSRFASAAIKKKRKRVKRYDKVAIQARSVTKAARRVVLIAFFFVLTAMWAAVLVIQCLAGGGDKFCAGYIVLRFIAKMLAVLGLHVIFRYFERGRYLRKEGKGGAASSRGAASTNSQAISNTKHGFAPVDEADEESGNIEMGTVEALSLSPRQDDSSAGTSEARDQFSVTIHERDDAGEMPAPKHDRDRSLSTSTPIIMGEMAKGIKPRKKSSK